MTQHPFTLTFWGVRGGYPVPGPDTVRYGGNTSCYEVNAGGHRLIIDGGTGIIGLGRKMMAERKASGRVSEAILLITHLHHDHIQGLPFFFPLRDPGFSVDVYGKPDMKKELPHVLDRVMHAPIFPVETVDLPSARTCNSAHHGDMILLKKQYETELFPSGFWNPEDLTDDDTVVTIAEGDNHPNGGVLFFRIAYGGRSLVIATDTEGRIGGDRRISAFARDADVLVHDAEYDIDEYADGAIPHQGWGHSTWQMAVEVARLAQAERLILTHHAALRTDDELEAMALKAQREFPAAMLAREGVTIEL